MKNLDGGKGSSPRPYSVDAETFSDNWDLIFNKKKKEDNTGVTKNDYQDILSTEDCIDDLEKYKLEAQKLWNDSCTSQRKK
jgi:hypothetical protein